MDNSIIIEAAETAVDGLNYRRVRSGHENGEREAVRSRPVSKDLTGTDDEHSTLLPAQAPDPLTDSDDERIGRRPSRPGPLDDFEGMPWWKTPSVYWLIPPFMIFTLLFGGVMVPRINIILSLVCRDYLSDKTIQDPGFTMAPVLIGDDNPQCQIPEVQALVSRFTLYGSLISGLLSAITSPRLGALSDSYGRLKVIAAASCGMLVGEILTIIIATWPDAFNVYWLLLGFMFDGICGSFIVAMAVSHSYATDCTEPAKRNVVFGYFHGCLFLGLAVGPALGGVVVKATGTILSVFYTALAAHLLFIACLLFVIPESLSKRRQLAARERRRFNKSLDSESRRTWVQSLKKMNLLAPLDILFPTDDGSSPALRRNLILLAAVDTIMFGVAMGSMTIMMIYAEYMFGWGNFETSIYVSVVNTCRLITLLVILPTVVYFVRRRTGNHPAPGHSGSDSIDITIIRIAVLFDMLGYLGYTLARTGPLFILSGALASVGGIGSPTLQSTLTKHVPPDRTGQLLGATGLLHALARVFSPTIFNLIYSLTVGKFTQTAFVCLTATFGLAFVLTWFIRPNIYLHDDDVAPPPPPYRDDTETND